MTLTQVRESPHISKPNAKPHTGEDVLGFVVPLEPVPSLFLFLPVKIFMARDPEIQTWVWKDQSHGDYMCTEAEGQCPLLYS